MPRFSSGRRTSWMRCSRPRALSVRPCAGWFPRVLGACAACRRGHAVVLGGRRVEGGESGTAAQDAACHPSSIYSDIETLGNMRVTTGFP